MSVTYERDPNQTDRFSEEGARVTLRDGFSVLQKSTRLFPDDVTYVHLSQLFNDNTGSGGFVSIEIMDKMADLFNWLSMITGTKCNIVLCDPTSTLLDLEDSVSMINTIMSNHTWPRLDLMNRNLCPIIICDKLKERKVRDPSNHFLLLDFCIKDGLKRLTFYDSLAVPNSYASIIWVLSHDLRRFLVDTASLENVQDITNHPFFGNNNPITLIYQWTSFLELYLDSVRQIPLEKSVRPVEKGKVIDLTDEIVEDTNVLEKNFLEATALNVPRLIRGDSAKDKKFNEDTDQCRDKWIIEYRGYNTYQGKLETPDCAIYSLFLEEVLSLGDSRSVKDGLDMANSVMTWSSGKYTNPVTNDKFVPCSTQPKSYPDSGIHETIRKSLFRNNEKASNHWIRSCRPKDDLQEIVERRELYRRLLEVANEGRFLLDILYHSFTPIILLDKVLDFKHAWSNWKPHVKKNGKLRDDQKFIIVVNCPDQIQTTSITTAVQEVLVRKGCLDCSLVYSTNEYLEKINKSPIVFSCSAHPRKSDKKCSKCKKMQQRKSEWDMNIWSKVNLFINLAADCTFSTEDNTSEIESMLKGRGYIKCIYESHKRHNQVLNERRKRSLNQDDEEGIDLSCSSSNSSFASSPNSSQGMATDDESSEAMEPNENRNGHSSGSEDDDEFIIQKHLEFPQCTIINGYRSKYMDKKAWKSEFSHLFIDNLKNDPYCVSPEDCPSPWYIQLFSTLNAKESFLIRNPSDCVDTLEVALYSPSDMQTSLSCLVPVNRYNDETFSGRLNFMSFGYL